MANRKGRKRNPQAKRRQTTRVGQGRENPMLPELQFRKAIALGIPLACDIRRREILGVANSDVDPNDPVSVLAARGLIRLAKYSPTDLMAEADTYRRLALIHIGTTDAKAAHLTGLVGQGSLQVTPDFDPERDKDSFLAYVYRRAAIKRRIGLDGYWEHFHPLFVAKAFSSYFPAILDKTYPAGYMTALEGLAAMVDLRMGRRRS